MVEREQRPRAVDGGYNRSEGQGGLQSRLVDERAAA
jgi:hypothetical protein